MRNRFLLILFVLFVFFQTTALPSFAERWDYVLRDYPNSYDQKIVKMYLNEFDKTLKNNWYSPLYRRQNAKFVFLNLHKDGTITVEKIVQNQGFKELDPYNKSFEKYIGQFFSEYKFKPFPKEIKTNEIKMAYALVPNYTFYYMIAGYGAIVINKSNKEFLLQNNF